MTSAANGSGTGKKKTFPWPNLDTNAKYLFDDNNLFQLLNYLEKID